MFRFRKKSDKRGKKEQHKVSFTEGPLNKHLTALSWPAFITILANLSFIVVDTYFLSRLGKTPLTAISFVFPMVAFFQLIANGLGIAASSVLSRLIGANKHEAVGVTIASMLLLALVIVAVMTPLVILGINPIFHMMGASNVVMPYIRSFMHVWLIGFLLVIISFMGSNILRAHGQAKRSARLQTLSSIINLILSPLLIFTFKFGIAGSALAGVLARLLIMIVMFSYIIKHYLPNAKHYFVCAIKSFGSQLKSLGSIAVPAILSNAIGPISSFWMVHLLAQFGGAAVAGFGIATRIEMLAVVPLYALSASIGPIIGQNMGRKFYDRAYRTLITSYKISLLWGALIAMLLLFCGHAVALIFSHDPYIIHIATLYLAILPCSYASWGLIMMTNANFNAMGSPYRSTMITLLRLCVIFIPLSYLLGHEFGYVGVFVAFAMSNVLTSLWALFTGIVNWKKLNANKKDMSSAPVFVARNALKSVS